MMFRELASRRESCRAYVPGKQVPHEQLVEILEIACLAPSAVNAQPWHFHLCEGETAERVSALCRVYGINAWTVDCPAFIVIESEEHISNAYNGGPRDYCMADSGIAAAHITLAAADLGLGTCIMGAFDEAAVKVLLDVKAENRVRFVISVGYPAAPLREKIRRPFAESVTMHG